MYYKYNVTLVYSAYWCVTIALHEIIDEIIFCLTVSGISIKLRLFGMFTQSSYHNLC